MSSFAVAFLSGYPKKATPQEIDDLTTLISEQAPSRDVLSLAYRNLKLSRIQYPPMPARVIDWIWQAKDDLQRIREGLLIFTEAVEVKEQELVSFQENLQDWTEQTKEQQEMAELEKLFGDTAHR